MVCYVGALLAKKNDPSVTRLGRLLHAIALDELLQVINIPRGDMSLWGPRAERPELMEKFSKEIPNFSQRLMVRPGVAGVAQVYGKYNWPPAEKLIYDLQYIEKINPWLDIKLLFSLCILLLKASGNRGRRKFETKRLKGWEIGGPRD